MYTFLFRRTPVQVFLHQDLELILLAKKSGFEDNIIVGNALVIMYSKSGNINEANKEFSDMIFQDTITWNAMICA